MDLEHFSREVLMIPFEPFSVPGERSGQRHRLTPVGELDLATVPVLEREFNAALLGDADTIASSSISVSSSSWTPAGSVPSCPWTTRAAAGRRGCG
jgi:hypothetical protein